MAGSIWVKVFPSEGGAAGGIGWAKVTGGTVTEYTKPDGSVMEVHTFTANGTLTVNEPGYAEVLLVGCGGSGYNMGNGGDVREGGHMLPVGAVPVVVGTPSDTLGRASSLGSITTGVVWASQFDLGEAVGAGAQFPMPPYENIALPYYSSITGTSKPYAPSATWDGRTGTEPGAGSMVTGTGVPGIVIVAVQKSAPTVSGVVATGGTVTEYTGDGTNGVLGQKYRVHTFSADGALEVSTGGTADVLLVASGGGGSAKGDGIGGSGGGGGVLFVPGMTLTGGTHTVKVGPAVPATTSPFAGTQGNPSQFDGLYAYGGGGGGFEDNPGGFGGSGGGGGGGNNIKDGGVGIPGQGFNGGRAPSLFSSGGAGGAGGPGNGTTPGPGRSLSITGTAVEYGKGGVDGQAGSLPGMGGGSYEGPGNGTSFASAAGVVIVAYEIGA